MSRTLIILCICFLGSVMSQIPVRYQILHNNMGVELGPSITPQEFQLGAVNNISIQVLSTDYFYIGTKVNYLLFYEQSPHPLISQEIILPDSVANTGYNLRIQFPLSLPSHLEKGNYTLDVNVYGQVSGVENVNPIFARLNLRDI